MIQPQESLISEAETETESVVKTVPKSMIDAQEPKTEILTEPVAKIVSDYIAHEKPVQSEQSFNLGLIPSFDWRRFGGSGRIGKLTFVHSIIYENIYY